MTLIAGTMGTSQLAVYTLLLNTYYLVYMIPYGTADERSTLTLKVSVWQLVRASQTC